MMIDCHAAMQLMLVADPDELRGAGAGELAQHIVGCAACRARAESILAEMTRLNDALSLATSLHDDAVHDRTQPLRSAARSRVPVHAHAHGVTPSRVVTRMILPLAAAAALILVVRQNITRERGPLPPILMPPVTVADVPIVNAPTDRNVAVMNTSDPKITVVWYY